MMTRLPLDIRPELGSFRTKLRLVNPKKTHKNPYSASVRTDLHVAVVNLLVLSLRQLTKET